MAVAVAVVLPKIVWNGFRNVDKKLCVCAREFFVNVLYNTAAIILVPIV